MKLHLKFVLSVLILTIITSHLLAQKVFEVQADNGILDLRSIDFSDIYSVSLSGEWRFFENRFVTTEQAKNDSNYCLVDVPENLKNQLCNNQAIEDYGYGSYYLKIIINPQYKNSVFKLYSIRINSASKIYINDKLAGYNGTAAESESKAIPSLKMHYFSNFYSSDTLNLVIHVSNYKTRKYGIYSPLTFGLADKMMHAELLRAIEDFFITGSFLLLVFYLLMIYVFRRDKQNLYLGLTIFFWAYFILGFGRNYYYIMPDFGYKLNYDIRHIALYFLFASFTAYVYELFKVWFNKYLFQIIIYVSIFFTILTLFTGIKTNTSFSLYYSIFGLIAFVYLLYVVIKAMLNGDKGAILFFVGILIFWITGIHDYLLESKKIISARFFMPYGILSFLILQVYHLSQNYNKTFLKAETLSKKLSFINNNLEELVSNRTIKIREQNNIIEQQNKDLTEINATKEKFFSIIAHDIRSPFASIYSISQFLNEDFENIDTKVQKDMVKHLNSSTDTVLKLLDNLLLWTRSHGKEILFNPEVISLNEILNSAIEVLRLSLFDKELTLNNKISGIYNVYADRNMLELIFRNLISNAMKYTPSGGMITIDSKIIKNFIHIEIIDTGIGMTDEKVLSLFNISDNKSTPGTNNEKGTGLGLLLCKEFVEKNGGKIHVQSILNQGSNFNFTIPLANEH